MTERDYSHVPLWHKLGAKQGSRIDVLHRPVSVVALEELPDGASRGRAGSDVIITFMTDAAKVSDEFARLTPKLADRGGLWMAWPKKTSSIPNSLDFNKVQHAGLSCGLVDNKVCRIDDEWQAVRFVRRVKK
jgi:hypothetical protein